MCTLYTARQPVRYVDHVHHLSNVAAPGALDWVESDWMHRSPMSWVSLRLEQGWMEWAGHPTSELLDSEAHYDYAVIATSCTLHGDRLWSR